LSQFQAILFLKDRQPPATREGLLDEISRQICINIQVFTDLAAVRNGTKKPGNDEALKLMNAYISEIKIITKQIDEFKPIKEDER
jgi:hypothetical protein